MNRSLALIAGSVTVALVAFASGYGYHRDELYFLAAQGCTVASRIDNGANVDNEEQGAPVMVCNGPRRPWSQEWDALRHFG